MTNGIDHTEKGEWLDSSDIGTFPNESGEAARTPGDSQEIGDEFGVFPVHAALLPTGKVLLWSGHYERQNYLYESWTWDPFGGTNRYDVSTNVEVQPFSTTHGRGATPSDEPGIDMFCAHHVFLEDGRLLVVGGDTPAGHTNDTLHIYDPDFDEWSKVDGTMVGGRWYPTVVLMPDGRATIFSGWSDDGPDDETYHHILETVELVDPPEHDPELSEYDPHVVDTTTSRHLPIYPGLHLVPGGRLFYTGTSWLYGRAEDDGFVDIDPPQTISFRMTGATSGSWKDDYTDTAGNPLKPETWRREEGASVLLPPAQRGRILLVGGAEATFSADGFDELHSASSPDSWEVLETQGGPPRWSASGTMAHERINVTTTLLPDGTVLILGGHNRYKFNHPSDGHAMKAELFDPEKALDGDPSTDPFTETGEMARARMYHSVALLLPDGSVFVAGGEDGHESSNPTTETSPGETREPHPDDQKNYEIYKPPYFFDGDRPESIVGSVSRADGPDDEISYGGRFTIETGDAMDISEVVLMRPGSITHHTDTEQRHVPLTVVEKGDVELTVEVLNDPSIAPPGYYMVFTVDDQGNPCERAEFVRLSNRSCDLATDRSHFSEDAVPDDGATHEDAFYVIYEGFAPAELGIESTSPTMDDRRDFAPSISFEHEDGSTVGDMDAPVPDVIFEDESRSLEHRQRVTIRYDVQFTGTGVFFDDDGEPIEEQNVRIVAEKEGYTCSGEVTLIHQPNPYMLDGSPHWLSIDVRVFNIQAGERRFGAALNETDPDPNAFITSVVGNFNTDDGLDFDDDLPTDPEMSELELSRSVDGTRVFNFAVAQVRYRGRTLDAEDVRVFFRLFTTLGSSLDFQPSTSYRRHEAPDDRIVPLLGTKDEEILSIPFFAESRVDTYGTGATSMREQTDAPNERTIESSSNGQVQEYFGCWLDFNQGTERYPLSPSPGDDGPYEVGDDGPYVEDQMRSIQQLIRGEHQCLVAEINFDPDPGTGGTNGTDVLEPGAGPADSDNLSQRNLAIAESENPGDAATRSVQHTFDLEPTWYGGGDLAREFTLAAALDQPFPPRGGPDELMLVGEDLPPETTATLYLPSIDADAVASHARMRGGPETLQAVDDHTVRCTLDDAAYVPLLTGDFANVAGLLTVELPDGVREGQRFRLQVKQRSRVNDRIEGTFEVLIPVRSAEDILPAEERRLSVLRHIAASIPQGDRWYSIFRAKLQHGADRVNGLGGDAAEVAPSPDGTGGAPAVDPDDRRLATATGGVGALFVAGLAGLGTGVGTAVAGILGLVALGAAAAWNARSDPSVCRQLRLYLASAAVGTAVLALLVLAGLAGTVGLVLGAVLVGVLAVLALAYGCLDPRTA